MRVMLTLYLISTSAFAFERCYVETAPAGKSTCFLVNNNATITCEGQDKRRTANCSTKTDDPIHCELRPTKLQEPADIWCEIVTPPPVESGIGINVRAHEGVPRVRDPRAYEQSETTKPPKQTPKTICAGFEKGIFYAECIAKMTAAFHGVRPPKETVCNIDYSGRSARMTCREQ